MIRTIINIILALVFCALPMSAQIVLQEATEDLKAIDVEEHLGDTIPLDLKFVNSDGDTVLLRDFFNHGKPVILTLHYTNCPMLCSLVLNGVENGIKQMAFKPGKDFDLLSVSIDPKETFEDAAAVQNRYNQSLEIKGEPVWHFLVGDRENINQLAAALGFRYYYIEKTGQFAHPAVVFLLTETGMISRYLYGIEFKEQDLRLGLLEASEGKIGNTIDKLVLFCYHYDPDAEGYVVVAANIMKLGGVATMILLGVFLGLLWRREHSKKTKA